MEMAILVSLKEKLIQLKNKISHIQKNELENSIDVSGLNISNLRINQGMKMEKKYSLKRIALKGVAVGLSVALMLGALTSCGVKKNNSNNQKADYAVTETTDESDYVMNIDKSSIMGAKVADHLEETNIGYSSNTDFIDYLSQYKVSYEYEELFNYEEASNYFQNERDTVVTHKYSGFIKDGKVDEEALFQSVVANSPIFRQNGKHYMYTLIEDTKELKRIISYVAEAINADLGEKTDKELAELDCVLGELTIFYGTGVESAKVTTENALLVNPDMIRAMEITNNNENSFRNILYHETKHLEQVDCVDYKDYHYSQQGISRTTADLAVNPYQWLWSAEAGAEKGQMNLTRDEPTTYKYLVGYMETLDLIGIVSPYSVYGGDVEKTTTNRNIALFYQLMGVNNGISEEEVTKMMYAMEVMQGRVDNFQEIYESYYGVPLSNALYAKVKEGYRTSFLLESTKLFYNNLAMRLVNNDALTLEDVYYLVSVFEGDLNYHLQYNLNSNLKNPMVQDFLREYNDIQNHFWASLALNSGLDYQEILDGFSNYALLYNSSTGVSINARLGWMNEAQMHWLENKMNSQRMEFTVPIYSYVSELENHLGK